MLIAQCSRFTFPLNSGVMSTKTTAVQPEIPLRRRIRILERASSLSSLADAKIIPEMKHQDSVEDIAPSSFTDYESRSDTSGSENDDEKAGEEDERPEGLEKHEHLRPTVDMTNVHRRHTYDNTGPLSPKSKAWYEFDLAVVVALVSPVGNWLTGGDHIKNLLLIVLLIFYLHQIIESTIVHACFRHGDINPFASSPLDALSTVQAEISAPSYLSTRSRIRRGSLCAISGFGASQVRILLPIPHVPLSFSRGLSPSLRDCFRPRSRCCFLV